MRAAIAASIVLSGMAAVGAVIARLESMSAPVASFRSIRLGATPEDVRAARPGDGGWTTVAEPSGDLALERAEERYEFHQGMLVGVRARVPPTDPEAIGPELLVTPTSVLARARMPDGSVRVRLIARDCPTHAEEAARLVGEGDPRGLPRPDQPGSAPPRE